MGENWGKLKNKKRRIKRKKSTKLGIEIEKMKNPKIVHIKLIRKSMSLKRKLEGEVEVTESAADVLHDLYKSRPHHLAHSGGANYLQGCELSHGVMGTPGCVLSWNYTLVGKQRTGKSEIEEIDEEKKMVRQKVVEGDLLDEYKSLVFICHAIPKGKGRSIVKWTLEYEKVHPGIPEPSSMLDALLEAAKGIEGHHHGSK